jgi:proteasome lid subunit RPN8/RPN11
MRLERIALTEAVASALFEDYAAHRKSPRGAEETGWILMGIRQDGEAIVLAALPAGADREASVAHVHFDAGAQIAAARTLRRKDKRLHVIGVVHTHPDGMDHPSAADLAGDRVWVGRLRHGNAAFAIGTADCNGEPRFSWFVLSVGDSTYSPLPVRVCAAARKAVARG